MSLMIGMLVSDGMLLASDRMVSTVRKQEIIARPTECKMVWADDNTVVSVVGSCQMKRKDTGKYYVMNDVVRNAAVEAHEAGDMSLLPYMLMREVQGLANRSSSAYEGDGERDCVWFVANRREDGWFQLWVVNPFGAQNWNEGVRVVIDSRHGCSYRAAGIIDVADEMLCNGDWKHIRLEDACKLVEAVFVATNASMRYGGSTETVSEECDIYVMRDNGESGWYRGEPGFMEGGPLFADAPKRNKGKRRQEKKMPT